MVSLGMFPARALSMAVRRRGLPPGSPPFFAATVISLSSLVQPFDFLPSDAALVCLILDHRLCPDIPAPSNKLDSIEGYHAARCHARQAWTTLRPLGSIFRRRPVRLRLHRLHRAGVAAA